MATVRFEHIKYNEEKLTSHIEQKEVQELYDKLYEYRDSIDISGIKDVVNLMKESTVIRVEELIEEETQMNSVTLQISGEGVGYLHCSVPRDSEIGKAILSLANEFDEENLTSQENNIDKMVEKHSIAFENLSGSHEDDHTIG